MPWWALADLMVGSVLTFVDRGSHELKGLPGRWGLYAAMKQAEAGGSESITVPAAGIDVDSAGSH